MKHGSRLRRGSRHGAGLPGCYAIHEFGSACADFPIGLSVGESGILRDERLFGERRLRGSLADLSDARMLHDMALFGASGSFLVRPDAGLIAVVVAWLLALAMGAVTAAKGRWGWLILGFFLTGGWIWLVSGFLAPMPGSLWARWATSRELA